MKRAVVLSGGGTKGAYELGVWKALRKLGIDYQIVTGNSIGSVNGAMMTAGDFDACEQMWEEMTRDDFVGDEKAAELIAKELASGKITASAALEKRLVSGTVDNSPFLKFIEKNVNTKNVYDSDCDYGLVTVRIRDRKPFCLTKKEIPQKLLKDYIIASSSVYPIFPMHQIGEDYYIDGMYHDNLPIDFAAIMGAGEFIVVDLHTEPQHPDHANRPYVTYITPSEDLGGILSFDKARIEKNISMGYRDTMRTFGLYKGYVYCFKSESLKDFVEAIQRFNEGCAREEATINLNTKSRIKRAGETRIMFSMLDKYARGRTMGKEGYFLRGAEIAAEIFGLSQDKIWRMEDMVKELKTRLGSEEGYPDAAFFLQEKKHKRKDTVTLKLEHDSRYLTGCLYYAALAREIDYVLMLDILSILPRELAAALFFLSVTD